MTTVAWDGMTLAADTLAVTCESIRTYCQKVFRLPDGRLFGSAGGLSDGIAVRDWLSGDRDQKPDVEDFTGLLVELDGRAYKLEDDLTPMPITEPIYRAIGSGAHLAMAAMHLGHTAKQAVGLAREMDVYTGGEIDAVSLVPAPSKARKPKKTVIAGKKPKMPKKPRKPKATKGY